MACSSKITPEMVNFCRLAMCIIGPGTQMIRDIMSLKIQPSSLRNRVLYSNLKLNHEQKKQLSIGTDPDYSNFDISFMYLFLRTPGMCIPPIPAPTNGWGIPPSSKYHVTLGDDIERLRILKNHICSHIKKPELSKTEFDDKIAELKDIAQRIDNFLAPSTDFVTDIREMETENMENEVCNFYIEQIKELKQREQDLVEKITSVEERTDQMNTKLEGTIQKVETVSREVEVQKEKTDQMNTKLETVSQEVDTQKEKTDQMNTKLETVSQEVDVQKEKIDQMNTKLETVSQEVDTQKEKTEQMNIKLDEKLETLSHEAKIQKEQEDAFLKQIQKEDVLFVESNASKSMLSLLDNKRVITIIGITGQGKTALSRHAAIHLFKKGYKIFNIRSAEEFRRKCNPKTKAVYLMDDIFGKHYKMQYEIDSWLRTVDDVSEWSQEHDMHLLCTSQKIVWNECQPYMKTSKIFEEENILDLTLDSLTLLYSEKMEMLRKHLLFQKRNISERILQEIVTIETPIGFPYCCSSYSSNDELYTLGCGYFQNTKASLRKEFERLSEINIERFCVLLSVMVLGNSFPDSFEQILEASIGDKVQSILLPYGIKLIKNIKKLNRALKDLKGVYLQEQNGTVSFIHDAYIDAMCMVSSKRNISVILLNCTADFFHQYIRIDGTSSQTSHDTPMFSTAPNEDLFQCIIRLLQNGEFHLVFENPMFQDEHFLELLTKRVDEEPELFAFMAFPLKNEENKPSVLEYCFEANTELLARFAISCFKRFQIVSDICQDTLKICMNECLCIACRLGLLASVRELLNIGANVAYKSPKSHNLDPCLWSAAYGRIETLVLLKQHGANVNSVDSKMQTVLDYLIRYSLQDKKDESMDTFRQLMTKFDMKDLVYVFPVETFKTFSFSEILKHCPVDHVLSDGKTILRYMSEMSVTNKSISMDTLDQLMTKYDMKDLVYRFPVETLKLFSLCQILKYCPVDHVCSDGKTILHYMSEMSVTNKSISMDTLDQLMTKFDMKDLVYRFPVETLKLFSLCQILKYCPVDHVCSDGKTILHYMSEMSVTNKSISMYTLDQLMTKFDMKDLVYRFPVETFKLFPLCQILKYCPVDHVCSDGKTILHYMSEMSVTKKSSSEFLHFWMRGRNHRLVNLQDSKGKTPIMYVAEKANPNVLFILCFTEGADVNITDNEGKTALHHLMITWNKELQTYYNNKYRSCNMNYLLDMGRYEHNYLLEYFVSKLSRLSYREHTTYAQCCLILLVKNSNIYTDGNTKDPREYLFSPVKKEICTSIIEEAEKYSRLTNISL